MLAPVTHIHPLTSVRRERLLSMPGRVLVRKGQKVNATDTIAEADVSPEYLLLDVARGLGLSEKRADQFLQCKTADEVLADDVLAGPVGLMKRVIRAPKNGRVVVAGDGKILLQLATPPFKLLSGLPGTVFDLVEERGAVIETTGAVIQGVWGNGYIDYGLMLLLMKSPDEELKSDHLDVSLRGSIILSGHCAERDVFNAAKDLHIRGLILASMDTSLIKEALKVTFPIILIEGFGTLAMNSAAYKLLTTNERREVAINAEPWDRFSGKRPEVVIPLPAPGELPFPRDAVMFATDQMVRVLRAPYTSKIGRLINLPEGLRTLPSGLTTTVGEVRLESGDTVAVPLMNLEIVE